MPPKSTRFSLGRRSIIILNVNQRFARANQEKVSENILYCTTNINEGTRDQQSMTHKGLNVEEEHADKVVTTLVPVGRKVRPEEGDSNLGLTFCQSA